MPDRGKVIIKAWEHLDAIMGVAKHLNYPDYGVVQEHCLAILALLKEQEAVVRCKDCKYYRATPGYCAYDRIWQENKGHIWGMYCKPDWFCADGEKEGR